MQDLQACFVSERGGLGGDPGRAVEREGRSYVPGTVLDSLRTCSK